MLSLSIFSRREITKQDVEEFGRLHGGKFMDFGPESFMEIPLNDFRYDSLAIDLDTNPELIYFDEETINSIESFMGGNILSIAYIYTITGNQINDYGIQILNNAVEMFDGYVVDNGLNFWKEFRSVVSDERIVK
jgi:hypothetical protein